MTCNMYWYLKYFGNFLKMVRLNKHDCLYNCGRGPPDLLVVHVKGSFNNPPNDKNGVRLQIISLAKIAKRGLRKSRQQVSIVQNLSYNCI